MYFALVMAMAMIMVTGHLSLVSTTESDSDLLIVKAAEAIMNAMIEESEILVRNAVPEVPKGEAYNEHRENLEKFLQETAEYKSKTGDCQAKRLKYNQSTSAIMKTYLVENPNATAEQKVMARLLNKHGMRDLRAKFKSLLEEVYSGKYGTPTKNIEKVYAEYTAKNCYTVQKNEL
uniref:Uncharacterized protein n=1 Tax=Stomoxys calcitrans TaxID=35570 RepID=A0A1I8PJC6_STOCA